MTTKRKSRKDTNRAMRDVSDLPPTTFALPDDGRQAKHLQRQRKEVAVQIAKHANADGTQSYPAITTLMKPMGCSRATIFRLLADLRTLGFLHDGDIHGFRKTRIRTLDLRKMAPVASSQEDPSHLDEDDPSHLQDDPSQVQEAPVSSTTPSVSSTEAPVSSIPSTRQGQDETQPSTDRPSKPNKTVLTDRDDGEPGSVSKTDAGNHSKSLSRAEKALQRFRENSKRAGAL